MDHPTPPTRRVFLAAAGAAVGMTVAGCADDEAQADEAGAAATDEDDEGADAADEAEETDAEEEEPASDFDDLEWDPDADEAFELVQTRWYQGESGDSEMPFIEVTIRNNTDDEAEPWARHQIFQEEREIDDTGADAGTLEPGEESTWEYPVALTTRDEMEAATTWRVWVEQCEMREDADYVCAADEPDELYLGAYEFAAPAEGEEYEPDEEDFVGRASTEGNE